ncbi:MAG: SiaC family regulatory phosphoprotein [Bacteroidales bacterium]|nr:SiaC family regulatory phosphoprotein [Bacteroidales bacterium]
MSKPNTPDVNFSEGKLRLTGRSVIADSDSFFDPIIDKVISTIQSSNPLKEIEISLDYINSSTVRSLLKMFIQLEGLNKAGNSINVRWLYQSEDEIMYEHGKTFEAIVELPLELIAFSS